MADAHVRVSLPVAAVKNIVTTNCTQRVPSATPLVRNMDCFRVVSLALVVALVGAHVAGAQEAPDQAQRPTIRAIYVPDGITVDGRLDEAVYESATAITDFIQQEPHEGMPATEKTEAWILFDSENLYIAARMWDSHPERMIANEMRRDASTEIYNNENLSIVLDTFHDQRSGFYFMTNILGAMRDVQFVSERQSNGEWNPIWNPRCERFEHGWIAEIEIPFRSLRYPGGGEQVWGFQLRRVVRWKNEIAYLTRVPASMGPGGIYRMQDQATLIGLRTPPAGRNLEIKPYVSSRVSTDRTIAPALVNDLAADAGLDVKYGITQALTADFTYNTDFAQVESDVQEVNLTRFSLFFPEKREFFLEGQGIFDFGGQTGGGHNAGAGDIPTMFFSRQIGLVRGTPVPVRAGARMTGKVGAYSVGLVNIQTEESTHADSPSTNFAVGRVRRDILGKSYVGVLATHRHPAGGADNTLVGADANFAFGLTSINLYYARTRTPNLEERDSSYLVSYDYNADRYGVNLQHLTVQPHFNPEIGFLRRQDFRTHHASARFSPRPAPTSAHLKAFRKFYYEGSFDYTTNNDNELESRAAVVAFRADLENGSALTTSVERDDEVLTEPFTIAPNVVLPMGQYSFDRMNTSYQLAPRLRIRGSLGLSAGGFYDGTRTEVRYQGRIAVSAQVTIEPTISLNWVDLPAGSFETSLVSTRTTYTLSPRSALGALVQYNSLARTISSNIRLRWEYTPGSDFYVVYTEGRTTLIPDRFSALQSRALIIKLTRLFAR